MPDPPESAKPAPVKATPPDPSAQAVPDLGDLFAKLADPETMKELEANDRRIKEIRKGWVKFENHVIPVWHVALQNMSRDIAEIKRLVGADGVSRVPASSQRATQKEGLGPSPPPVKPDRPPKSKDAEEE